VMCIAACSCLDCSSCTLDQQQLQTAHAVVLQLSYVMYMSGCVVSNLSICRCRVDMYVNVHAAVMVRMQPDHLLQCCLLDCAAAQVPS
jgi:hypothetical protein